MFQNKPHQHLTISIAGTGSSNLNGFWLLIDFNLKRTIECGFKHSSLVTLLYGQRKQERADQRNC